jgi:hypothetical protein
VAKSTTAEEFEDNMQLVVCISRRKLRRLKPKPLHAKYSWDNNQIQAAADITKMGLRQRHRAPLPAYSPDMHQIVEHTIGKIKKDLMHAVLAHEGPMTSATAQRLAKRVFKGISASSIHANKEKLVSCWQAIAAPAGVMVECADGKWHKGSGGDYPEAALC